MIPLKALSLEHDHGHKCEDCKRDHFLDHLELHKVEGASVIDESDSVGRYLSAVLKECDSPGKENHCNERPA